MATLADNLPKLELTYPCSWTYKLIAIDREQINIAIEDIINPREHKLKASKASRSGKYISMNLELLVHNEDDRTALYESFKAHKDIKMVL